jgi:DNA-directed RNA polymerase subunit D
MIKIQKLKENKEKISFIVRGINNTIANSIRRSVFEIPVLAIDSVEFYKNDSALYDEILAHRLGLVPLKAPKTFTRKEECSCKGKGCLKCTASLKLKAKGPCTVYTADLKAKGSEPVFNMPIVILTKDQELEFSAEACLGTAKEHAKFSPGLVWFNAIPIIKLTRETEAYEDVIAVCPKKAIISKGKKIEIDALKCDLCEACMEYCNKNNKEPLDIKASEEDFIFHVESFGQLEPSKIFTEAIDSLDKNLDEFAKLVKKAK